MKFIAACMIIGNILLLFAIDAFLWLYSTALVGFFGLIAIVVWFIAYALSIPLAIAPRDFWTNPKFGILTKRLGFANAAAFATWGTCLVVVLFCAS
jgi:hypothetical protein